MSLFSQAQEHFTFNFLLFPLYLFLSHFHVERGAAAVAAARMKEVFVLRTDYLIT
jgi:hypothetical protein